MKLQTLDDPRISQFLRLDRGNVVEHPDGSIEVVGLAARPGVYIYHDARGTTRELVTAEELRASAPGLEHQGITVYHPDGLVDASRAADLDHGHVMKAWVLDAGDPLLAQWSNARVDDLAVRVKITTDQAKQALADGAVQLSPAYNVDARPIPAGHPDAARADVVQVGREYNRLALVPAARGGERMHLRLDGAREQRVQSERHDKAQPRTPMIAIVKYQGETHRLDADLVRPYLAVRLDAARADQIETGEVSITFEGEDADVFRLPKSLITTMLASVGIDPSGDMPAGEGAATVEAETVVAEEPIEDAAAGPRADALDAAVKAAVKRELDRRDAATKLETGVREDAAALLPAEYEFTRSPDVWATAGDAIARVRPDRSDSARKLAGRARAGDQFAQGQIRGLLGGLREDGATGSTIVQVDPKKTTKKDGATVSPIAAAAAQRDARQSGKASK